MKFYPVQDPIRRAELQALGVGGSEYSEHNLRTSHPRPGGATLCILAIATGEHRAPKAGEWYLSGALVAAYRANNDLNAMYHIAKLVLVQEKLEIVRTPVKLNKPAPIEEEADHVP